jgi:hypothetical protein
VRDLLQLSDPIYVCVVERFPHEFVMLLRKTSCINMCLIDLIIKYINCFVHVGLLSWYQS